MAEIVVTREHGGERLLEASVTDPSPSETVARVLDRHAELETSYGGNFIDSIEGLAGGENATGRRDWFFYVNGYWSPVGAAEARVRPGDRIWWDHRPWQVAYRVPAVVGSWPEPFLHGEQGTEPITKIECVDAGDACADARAALEAAGARLGNDDAEVRVLVGPLRSLAGDPDAELLGEGPGESGVYVRIERDGELTALNQAGDPARQLGSGSGLIAAVRRDGRPVAWVITGVGAGGVEAAVDQLSADSLTDAYALAIDPAGEALALPVR